MYPPEPAIEEEQEDGVVAQEVTVANLKDPTQEDSIAPAESAPEQK